MKTISPTPHVQGFSLIEMLVTIVLVAIGVLGMVAMQARTITFTQDSVQRNAAAMLADDLIEIIRSADIVDSNGLPPSTSGYYKAKSSTFPNAPETCSPLPASASQRLSCWAKKTGEILPGAADLLSSDFYICRSATPTNCSTNGSAIEIQLAWQVKKGECLDATASEEDEKVTCRYRLRTEL
ncbi:type IV pilus modification protein PilV [Azomonas macrocytogenes]|uniref:Type IV pilus assembly protein PilV n=1 Tax=Azomonas macrocytogenes TaxID=69962 RepID=A0A839SZI7_AZOMA|nr:type IV pilus modification protein PilV [Azomonas macrocytogenes]MBB3102109.1 type IV pilus assembly protein PilV [Azomonas macrocytogenes]